MRFNQKLAVILASTALGMAGIAAFLGQTNRLSASQQVLITESEESIEFNAKISDEFPFGKRWLDHLKQDLLPFWTMKSASGNPLGNFPTFRCNDGSLLNPINPCTELKDAEPWIRENLNKEFVVSKSRQTYVYGVAYHLTGDEKMLHLAKAGVDYLRRKAYEKSTGSAITSWKNGISDTPVLQRTTQELAYAQLGLSFYYYLTRDDEVLKDIIRLKNHIFNNYYNPNWDMLMWVKQEPEWSKDNELKESERKTLVAQLDQLNAYMILLTPLLPEPEQTQWKKDMVHLTRIMLQQYYSPQHNLFWSSLNEQEKKLGKHQTDFGHTIKALWMINFVGKLTNNNYLTTFAELQASKVLNQAYIEKTGSWASWLNSDGKLNEDKHWWIYAELDQMAATLSLKYPSFTKYLTKTYDYWFKHMVDPENHEIWAVVDASGRPTQQYPKVYLWKNGYHSLEHALVGYITSQAFHRKPVILYYAYKKEPPSETIHPYFYAGKIQNQEISNLKSFRNYKRIKVTFTNIQ
jgi:mannose/cellobiose epimerase-like protein (N-acyl-D-glucosamine 2-epimerase family)